MLVSAKSVFQYIALQEPALVRRRGLNSLTEVITVTRRPALYNKQAMRLNDSSFGFKKAVLSWLDDISSNNETFVRVV